MESIARQSEVSKRTLYKYFPNKETIFEALVSELLEVACGNPLVVYSKELPIKDQISCIIDH